MQSASRQETADNRQTTAKTLDSCLPPSFIVPCVASTPIAAHLAVMINSRIKRVRGYAMFYVRVVTAGRHSAGILRSCLRYNLYLCSLQEIAVAVVKKSTIRASAPTCRVHVREPPRAELSRFSSFTLRAKPCENLIAAFGMWAKQQDIRVECKNWCTKWNKPKI